MATNTKAKTSAEFQKLSATLGTKPPKGLSALPASDLEHLDEQIGRALDLHQETMAQAEESIINQAPRPLRGTIRKILGA
jgi:hypothetical protein